MSEENFKTPKDEPIIGKVVDPEVGSKTFKEKLQGFATNEVKDFAVNEVKDFVAESTAPPEIGTKTKFLAWANITMPPFAWVLYLMAIFISESKTLLAVGILFGLLHLAQFIVGFLLNTAVLATEKLGDLTNLTNVLSRVPLDKTPLDRIPDAANMAGTAANMAGNVYFNRVIGPKLAILGTLNFLALIVGIVCAVTMGILFI